METESSLLNKYWYQDKTPELALFFNLAFDKIAKFIKTENPETTEPISTIASFEGNYYDESLPDFSEATYIKLKTYLWKGFENRRNSEGMGVSLNDKARVRELLNKLLKIRNFQSHYYHDNASLRFDLPLKNFIEKLYENALAKLSEDFEIEIREYRHRISERLKEKPWAGELFTQSKEGEEYYLSREGKNFVLSLFLTIGEMKRFLKQRKGCKRDDTKDFRIKHAIYLYYCHRDGASRFHYNQNEDALNETEKEIAREVYQHRQLYKLNTYLNDVPSEITMPELFPLYADNHLLGKAADLIQFCKSRGYLSNFQFNVELLSKPKLRGKDEKKNKPKEAGIIIKSIHYPELCILISARTFHQLILKILMEGDEKLTRILTAFYKERNQLLELLKKPKLLHDISLRNKTALTTALDQYDMFRLRSRHIGLQRSFAKWLTAFGANSDDETGLRERLLIKLQELPINLGYLDFYHSDTRKPRQKDEFMHFAVHYLIDHNILPEISWQWQAFDVVENAKAERVLKEISCFQPQKPSFRRPGQGESHWRLKFTFDNQILCTYKNPTQPKYKEERHKERPVQTFLIGHRAMRNLLIAHFQTRPISLFFEKLSAEVANLYAGEAKFEFLNAQSIPAFLKKNKTYDLRAKTLARLENLIRETAIGSAPKGILYQLLEKKDIMSRADKNRQIMRCYRLFDWPIRSSGVEIFLRKNEYELLSIYHYTLENKNRKLLDEINQTNKLPQEVMALLRQSRNLDELFDNTLRRCISYLGEKRNGMEGLPIRYVKPLARKIGVPVYEKSENQNRHVPFDIHPMFILKVLYEKELQKEPDYNLSYSIWNKATTGIREEYYMPNAPNADYHNFPTRYFALYNGPEAFQQSHKKEYRKILGVLNQRKTTDTLLFRIALSYDNLLRKSDQGSRLKKYIRVENMHDIFIPLFDEPITIHKGETEIRHKIRVQAKYRQWNDIYLLRHKEDIRDILKLMLYKYSKEELLTMGFKLVQDRSEHVYTADYIILKQELDRVYHQSLAIIEAVLKMEETILSRPENWQKAHAKSTEKAAPDMSHLNFSDIMDLGSVTGANKLSHLRSTALHAKIPNAKDGYAIWDYEDESIKNHPEIGEYLRPVLEKRQEKKNWYMAEKN